MKWVITSLLNRLTISPFQALIQRPKNNMDHIEKALTEESYEVLKELDRARAERERLRVAIETMRLSYSLDQGKYGGTGVAEELRLILDDPTKPETDLATLNVKLAKMQFALEKIVRQSKEWEGQSVVPFWNLGDIAKRGLK